MKTNELAGALKNRPSNRDNTDHDDSVSWNCWMLSATDDSLYLQQRTWPLKNQSHPTPAQPSVLHLTNASPVLWTLQSINHVTATTGESIRIRSVMSCKCSTTSTKTTRAGAKVIFITADQANLRQMSVIFLWNTVDYYSRRWSMIHSEPKTMDNTQTSVILVAQTASICQCL